jgi:hypothetical protein
VARLFRLPATRGKSATLLLAGLLAVSGFRLSSVVAAPPAPTSINASSSYGDWRTAASTAPSYRSLKGRLPPVSALPFRSLGVLLDLARSFTQQCGTNALAQPEVWTGPSPDRDDFFAPNRSYLTDPKVPFLPFAQKVVVPAGSEIVFQGDLHGDLHSLLASCEWLREHGYLDGFRLARQDVWLVFLGDYTDRGVYGAEVLYTLLRLKLANPERVVLVRGNHEDYRLVSQYGFLAELQMKFPGQHDLRPLWRVFDFLPVVLYLGCGGDFIQCNHGGLEPGYDPRALLLAPGTLGFHLLGQIRQATFLRAHASWREALGTARQPGLAARFSDFEPTSPTTPATLGFLWNDFTIVTGQPEFEVDPDRALVYGPRATRDLLHLLSTERARVRAVFRGHQHSGVLNPMMARLVASGGLFRHWQPSDSLGLLHASPGHLATRLEREPSRPIPDGSVWTFNVSPDSIYGVGCGFTSSTLGMLKTADRFQDWRIQTVEIRVAHAR